MTAVDGDPLTGDPRDPEVQHLLAIMHRPLTPIPPVMSRPLVPTPVIHEPCGVGQCGGCSSRGCVTRKTATP